MADVNAHDLYAKAAWEQYQAWWTRCVDRGIYDVAKQRSLLDQWFDDCEDYLKSLATPE